MFYFGLWLKIMLFDTLRGSSVSLYAVIIVLMGVEDFYILK